MPDRSRTSRPLISTDMSSVTFSQALEAGLTHSGWLDGRTIDPCGRDHAPASHSASQGSEKEPMTGAIYGPLFGGSSPSENLQSSLANRLRQRMAAYGSPEYALTWKLWDMKSGPPICALRASVRRIKGRDCSGWQTPKTPTGGGQAERMTAGGGRRKLEDQVLMAGWATPRAGKTTEEKMESWIARKKRGDVATMPLTLQAQTAGWATPRANDAEKRGMVSEDPRNGLVNQANMSGWPTAQARDWRSGKSNQHRVNSRPLNGVAMNSGNLVHGGLALMGTFVESLHERINFRGALEPFIRPKKVSSKSRMLNPRFSLWLMGFPQEWASCAERVTPLSRRKRRKS